MLQDKIKECFIGNRDFLLASSLLLLTNTIDKIITFNGIKQGTHYEVNLIQNSMIENYGIASTMIFNALFPLLLIPLSKKLDDDLEEVISMKKDWLPNLKIGSCLVYGSAILSIYSTLYTVYNYFKF